MLEPVRPEAVLPDMALCLPTFCHFLIVNKTSLSLSLSLCLCLCVCLCVSVSSADKIEPSSYDHLLLYSQKRGEKGGNGAGGGEGWGKGTAAGVKCGHSVPLIRNGGGKVDSAKVMNNLGNSWYKFGWIIHFFCGVHLSSVRKKPHWRVGGGH